MRRKNSILLVAVPLMLILLGIVAYEYGYLRVRAELTDLEGMASSRSKTLAKYLALIAEKPGLEEKLADMEDKRKTDSSKMIEGQTPSIAAASLQSVVKGVITARGGNIASDRVEKAEEMGKFKMITVTVDSVMPDTKALGDILHTIETQTPYLVVREMDVRIRNFKDPRDLSVKLKVSGLTGGG